MRPFRSPVSLVVLTAALPVLVAAETTKGLPSSPPTPATFVTLFDFSGSAAEPGWTAVNDGVMGGVSRGGAKLVDGSLHFRGILSLDNNGGFSSIRSGGPIRDLSAAQVIVLRVKGDGRRYRLQLATDAQYRRSRISYQAEFPTQIGKWVEVRVPLVTLVPMFRGQTLSGPKLDRTRIEEIGVSLADGNPGAFSLEVDWIRAE
jgi:monofunctional biosynthetic peptidoglycan transglycosylase